MIKTNLFLVGMLFIINGSFFETTSNKNLNTVDSTTAVQKEVKEMRSIIEMKSQKIAMLETEGKRLLESNKASEEAKRMLEEASLQRLMILKYKAAIACRTR